MSLLAAALGLALCRPAAAAPVVYGFNFPVWSADGYSAAGGRFKELAATGARWVALTPTWYARTRRDSRIAPTDRTPTDASLRAAIREARALGLSVVLKPHVDVETGGPRAFLRPADAAAWFADYERFAVHYARLAQEEGCPLYVVGTELFMTSGPLHKARWERVIAAVRAVYKGRLTYAANWYDVARVPFWGSLDYIGVDAYYPLPAARPAELRLGWRLVADALGLLSRAYGKPVLVTEFGLSSQKGANRRPWDYGSFGPLDLAVQRDYIAAFLDALEGKDWFAGYLEWAWDAAPAGGPADRGMSVEGKPALDVLREHFERLSAPPSPVPAAAARAARLLGAPAFGS